MFNSTKIFLSAGIAMLLINPAISCDYYDASGDGNFTAAVSSSNTTATAPATITLAASAQTSSSGVFCFYEENADLPECAK